MPVRYSKQIEKTGAALGTIVSIVRPSTYTTSTTESVEASNWSIQQNYPGWLECDGRTLNVSDYRALYSVIGNTYGGTANVTFKLPDYRGKKVCGTGGVNGNSGSSLALSPNISPIGTPGGSFDIAGSVGGFYSISTIRQLPEGSEITPIAPGNPDIYYDVNSSFLISREILSGTARIAHGTGTTEIGGFLKPLIDDAGNNYLAFGTPGTSPFNSLQSLRTASYTFDLTGYSKIFIFAIAGNDSNGGERINNLGEGLRVVWPNGSDSIILPSKDDTGLDYDDYDLEYQAWRNLEVEIPLQYRTSNVTVVFKQQIVSTSTEFQPTVNASTNPNGYDAIGIQRIGFRGGQIGGEAIDTFSLGTFRSQGFSNVRGTTDPILEGSVSFGVGPVREVSVSAVPPHFHFTTTVTAGVAKASQGNPPAPKGGTTQQKASYKFKEATTGTIIPFNRSFRFWPGSPGGGFGSLDGFYTPDQLSITYSGARLQSFNQSALPRETGGFNSYDGSPGQYIAFGSSLNSSLQTNRSATFTVNAVGAENLFIYAICGNDSNGGERVNNQGESLKVFFNGDDQGIILPSRGDSPLDGSAYDDEYDTWKEREFPIPQAYRVSNLQIQFRQQTLQQDSEWDPNKNPAFSARGPDEYDMFGIAAIGLVGSEGDTYSYPGSSDPIILQRHAHMVYWEEPNSGDTVPGTVSTFGTGGGTGSSGLRSGTSASTSISTNTSIGTSITKTISVTEDIGNNIRPATVTLSDSSRTAFDNIISVRLQAAEEIILLTPYFRSKYIIKAY